MQSLAHPTKIKKQLVHLIPQSSPKLLRLIIVSIVMLLVHIQPRQQQNQISYRVLKTVEPLSSLRVRPQSLEVRPQEVSHLFLADQDVRHLLKRSLLLLIGIPSGVQDVFQPLKQLEILLLPHVLVQLPQQQRQYPLFYR